MSVLFRLDFPFKRAQATAGVDLLAHCWKPPLLFKFHAVCTRAVQCYVHILRTTSCKQG